MLRRFCTATLLLAAASMLSAAQPSKVELIVFPGGFNWPMWVAQEKGPVLALRSQHGQPHKELADPGKYYDLSYYDKAQPAMTVDRCPLGCHAPRRRGH